MKLFLYTIFKKPWPYWIGGILLGALNVLLFATNEQALKISSGISYEIGFCLEKLGHSIWEIPFFKYPTNQIASNATAIDNFYIFLIVGIILGSAIGCLFSSEWKIRKFKKKQVAYSLIGGICMGYGARIAMGCNIGGYFSAIPSFSLHGWVFGISIFIGSFIGIKILLKFMV